MDEADWLIRCPNCAANNCPEEEYPSRPLPIPLDYMKILQSRLVKVKKSILPPILKIILKTCYHLPAHRAPVTSPAVQPGDMIRRHRDGEHNSLELPQALEEDEKKGGCRRHLEHRSGRRFCFSNPGWDGPRSIASRCSPFRIGDVSATRYNSEDHRLGGRLPNSSRLRGEPENPRGICGQPASAKDDVDRAKQTVRLWRKKNELFISAKWLCCMLYALLHVFVFCLFANFPCYHVRYIKQQEFSAEDRSDRDTRTRGAAFELVMDHLDS